MDGFGISACKNVSQGPPLLPLDVGPRDIESSQHPNLEVDHGVEDISFTLQEIASIGPDSDLLPPLFHQINRSIKVSRRLLDSSKTLVESSPQKVQLG